jgi:D-serine deaminase-like pyridoxal phosphate-dependent protein
MPSVPNDVFFAHLQQRLQAGALGQPQVVLDLARVDRNLDRLRRALGPRALRVAVKSLPCPALVERIIAQAGTRRLMVFDAAMLEQCLARWPDADVLLGKPLPAAAVMRVVDRWTAGEFAQRASHVHFLVDTPQRIGQYAALAAAAGTRLGVCLELDVGMHRGGAGSPAEIDAVLAALDRAGVRLELRGFMGYDAHCAKAPWPRQPHAAARAAARAYAGLVAHARRSAPTVTATATLLDGSGSPTFTLLDPASPVNDVAVGSALVKPTDFDLPGLAEFEPAAWIAAPVLKDCKGVRLPFLERFERLTGRGRRTLFLYGGRWMARPAWPPGLAASRLYGASSNQQMMTVPLGAAVAVDDYVFLRPTQSEVVLGQFGFVTALHANGRLEYWPTFPPGRVDDV